jgi:hypothetical protein
MGSCDEVWKRIWKLSVPKSAQNFLWRLAKNILPTRSNLEKKGIILDTSCPLCESAVENIDHLFMQCEVTRAVWFSSPLGIHVPPQVDIKCWMRTWLAASDVLAQQLFGVTLWMVWKSRNQKVFNSVKFDPVNVGMCASNFVEDFNKANLPIRTLLETQRPENWSPPDRNFIKINVDAGCFLDGSTGWGFIVRNAAGLVQFAATKLEGISVSPLLAECLGLRWCLAWAVDNRLSNIIIESDAEVVVKCLHGALVIAEIELVILDCLNLMNSLSNVIVVSISRHCNEVANSLVSLSRISGCCSWVGYMPDYCMDSYCKDLLSVK